MVIKQKQPTFFISHGAPTLLVDRDPTTNFLESLGENIAKPESILCISAHWETELPLVTGNSNPETIHDFYGFQKELYEFNYPCPGSSELTTKVVGKILAAGFDCNIDYARGLDHGAWVPLKLMFPKAEIPVVQLSLQRNKTPEYHYKLGLALQSLCDEDVLIICSGSATHNISGFGRFGLNAPAQDYVIEFDNWLLNAIETNDKVTMLDYQVTAPHAQKNHPTTEHIMPLFVALGVAGENRTGRQIHQAYTYGILSMAAYQWS